MVEQETPNIQSTEELVAPPTDTEIEKYDEIQDTHQYIPETNFENPTYTIGDKVINPSKEVDINIYDNTTEIDESTDQTPHDNITYQDINIFTEEQNNPEPESDPHHNTIITPDAIYTENKPYIDPNQTGPTIGGGSAPHEILLKENIETPKSPIMKLYKEIMAQYGITEPEITPYKFLEIVNEYIEKNKDPEMPIIITAHMIAAIPMKANMKDFIEKYGPAITKDNANFEEMMMQYDDLTSETNAYIELFNEIKPGLFYDAEELIGYTGMIKTIDTPQLEVMEHPDIITADAQKYIKDLITNIDPKSDESLFNYLEIMQLPIEYTIDPITIKDRIDSHPAITTEPLAKA